MNRRAFALTALGAAVVSRTAVSAGVAARASADPIDAVAPSDRSSMEVVTPYEVLPDNRVTFRFAAPKAASVAVDGEWPGGLGGDSTIAMVKDDQGLWSATVGPLASDLWSYTFLVDGVTVPPAFGPFVDPTPGLPAGSFVIPGPYGSDFAPQGNAKGVLAYPYVPFMGSAKHLTVYTPPQYYEQMNSRFPVLYLTMGGRHDGTTGLQDPHVFNLLENLIASNRAVPMIVVVLDPQAPGGNSVGWSSFEGGGNQTNEAYVRAAQVIADDIVPWIDKAFRTIADRDHRAIGGFSSPGAQGFLAGARNPHIFASLVTFSGGFPTWPGVGVQIESKLDPSKYIGPDLNRVPDMAKLGAMIPDLNAAARMRLVAQYIGTAEPLIQTYELMTKFLTERGVTFVGVENPGYTHEARNIRVSLRDFMMRVFR